MEGISSFLSCLEHFGRERLFCQRSLQNGMLLSQFDSEVCFHVACLFSRPYTDSSPASCRAGADLCRGDEAQEPIYVPAPEETFQQEEVNHEYSLSSAGYASPGFTGGSILPERESRNTQAWQTIKHPGGNSGRIWQLVNLPPPVPRPFPRGRGSERS